MDFNLSALREFELATGRNVLTGGFDEFNTTDSLELTRCGIRGAHSDFEMTIDEIGKHLHAGDLNTVMMAFAEDQGADMTEEKGEEDQAEKGE